MRRKEAGCEKIQVRQYFSKMRSSVRDFLTPPKIPTPHNSPQERMVQKAAGPSSPFGDQLSKQDHRQPEEVVDTSVAIVEEDALLLASTETAGVHPTQADDLARERLERHLEFLDVNGGIGRLEFVGEFANLMGMEKSWEMRREQLRAILVTSESHTDIGKNLCEVPSFLPTLESWLLAAEGDQQTSFLRHLIPVLANLRLHRNVLCSSNLPKAVAELQNYRDPDIAQAATVLCEHWHKMQANTAVM
eukprot:jgi/Botrbrau1/5015/Bobra.0396s0035.7